MTRHRPPAPDALCCNLILNDQEEWVPCGLPWDGTSPDAAPACVRCREVAGMAARVLARWLAAEIAAQQQRPDAA
jgi:hypothetical protein